MLSKTLKKLGYVVNRNRFTRRSRQVNLQKERKKQRIIRIVITKDFGYLKEDG
jgi:hypothetical protein